MKIHFFFFLLGILFFTIASNAQIPNAGFEDWDSNGNPIGWLVTNAPPAYTTVLKTSDAHSGNWAVEGDVVTYSVFTMSPSLISGDEGIGFPINFRPASLRGYYKFDSVGDDFMQVQANFRKNGIYIGGGAAYITPANSYTQFSINIDYLNGEVPDTATIAIFVANLGGFGHVGTKMFVDDLSWSNTSDVKELDNGIPGEYDLMQNYPNPFNPSTTIRYSIPEANFATIKVYDMLGNEVTTLVNEEQSAGNYEVEFNASELSSGIYFYKLQAGSFVETKKMILLR